MSELVVYILGVFLVTMFVARFTRERPMGAAMTGVFWPFLLITLLVILPFCALAKFASFFQKE